MERCNSETGEETLHRSGCRLLSQYAANNWLPYTLSSTGRSINSKHGNIMALRYEARLLCFCWGTWLWPDVGQAENF